MPLIKKSVVLEGTRKLRSGASFIHVLAQQIHSHVLALAACQQRGRVLDRTQEPNSAAYGGIKNADRTQEP
jgi:hypothetical protein